MAKNNAKEAKSITPTWKPVVDEKDFGAAADYLELRLGNDEQGKEIVLRTIADLRGATLITKKAKDIIRASGNEYLGADDPHVKKNLKKIKAGTPMSPVLLVSYDGFDRLIIADGYHRVCTVYNHDYDQEVPCLMVTVRVASQEAAKATTVARARSGARTPGDRAETTKRGGAQVGEVAA